MAERVARKLAAILAADVVGFSRLAGAEEERTLARLRALRGDLIDPAIAAHHGRTVKRTGDGTLIEFRSVVDAVRCAVEVQAGMVERNAGLAPERKIEFRVGVHLGDVMEESDGDLMGDGVNIAARLEGIAEPGGICLSEDAWRQVRDRVAEQFVDCGERALKNIARPMRVYALNPSPPLGAERLGEVRDSRASAAESPGAERQERPRLSIVVLPLANIGGDPEQEYFVDGVTESLTTDLSRIAGALVIGRNTAFTYKGKATDLKQIGRELNVRYVLEGSVQRSGNRMRVNVQLIDAETGNHLWAERFDKPLADLFDMQDEIVARLANTLNTQLIAAEARRAEHAANPNSIDLYFRGVACFQNGAKQEVLSQALRFFERALALDPKNVDAMTWGAWMDVLVAGPVYGPDRALRMARAEGAVIKALSLAPSHAFAHYVFGTTLMWTNRAEQGIAECEHALALDPGMAIARGYIGVARYFLGRFEESEADVREALRFSPRDTFAYAWMFVAGMAKLALGANEEAVAWLRRALEANRNYALTHFLLAVALLRLGRAPEARASIDAGLEIDPDFTLARFIAGAAGDNAAYLKHRAKIIDDLRATGLPEK